jgi:hypothetical protein
MTAFMRAFPDQPFRPGHLLAHRPRAQRPRRGHPRGPARRQRPHRGLREPRLLEEPLGALLRGRKVRNAVYTTRWHESRPTNPLTIADFEDFCREKSIRDRAPRAPARRLAHTLPLPSEPPRRVRPLRPRAGVTRRQARGLEEADAVARVLRVEPVGLEPGELALERVAAPADLDHENPVRLQAPAAWRTSLRTRPKPVRAAVEREARLPAELLGKGVHVRRRLVGRVA